jgi:hypothetical protein
MAREDERLADLRSALSELAAEDLPEVLAEARRLARERASSRLADALTDALLDALASPAPAAVRTSAPVEAGAVYVFGVLAAGGPTPTPLPAGIDGATPVRLITEGDLSAIVCSVDARDFDEEPLRAHLSDLAWVERTARRHEGVLEAMAAATTLVPMRMCSVYANEAGARGLLEREAGSLSDALAFLQGRAEWGVKVFAAGAPLSDPDPEPAPSARRETSGADYLQRRLRERDARSDAAHRAQEAVSTVHERLSVIAARAVLAPPQRSGMGGDGEMVLNGAYLVGAESESRFHAEVRALAEEYAPVGLSFETTGPWPAYNFVPGAIGAGW